MWPRSPSGLGRVREASIPCGGRFRCQTHNFNMASSCRCWRIATGFLPVTALHFHIPASSAAGLACNGVSVGHSVAPSQLQEGQLTSVVLTVQVEMTVICASTDSDDWGMADAIDVDGGARDPKAPTLFQVADVETGVVRWVCTDLVTHIVPRVCYGRRPRIK